MTQIITKQIPKQERYENEYLTPLAHQIMNLFIQNLTPIQIAERLRKERRYIATIINAPNFQHMLSIRRATVADEIDQRVINAEKEAADVLKAHAKEVAERMAMVALESNNEAMIIRAGSDILDRVGPQKRSKGSDASATVVVIDGDAAKLIKETMEMTKDKD